MSEGIAPPSTVDGLLRHRSAHFPDKAALIDPESQLSYAELEKTSSELAATLHEFGVTKGTRVGLIMPNGVRWGQLAVAVMRMGAVLVPLSTLLRPPELVAQLQVASVEVLVTVDEFRGHRYIDDLPAELHSPEFDGGLHPSLPALLRLCPVDQLDHLSSTDHGRDVAVALGESVTSADTMAVLFTSGSSGPPKGTIHSHGSAIGAVRAGLVDRCVSADSRLYLPMPLFWTGGFGGGLMTALVAGATLITEPAPNPPDTLRLLERERVTLFRGWPDQAETLAHCARRAGTDLSALRSGSLEALLPPAQRSRPGSRAVLFGMTESFGPYCGYRADTDMPSSAWGSCGRPFAGTDVRIVDPVSRQPVPSGTVGEIELRGPHLMRGVCGCSDEDMFTVDGFYPTGDLGHLDGAGFLFYRGRSDAMFKVAGASVYPSEVEGALRDIPGVARAVVVNVDSADGNRVGAAVVCDAAALTVEDLRAAARKVLSSFKVPTRWLVLESDDAIPRAASGKVDYRKLRVLLADAREPCQRNE